MRTKLPKLITLGLPVATLSAVSGLHFRAMAQEKAAVANPADDLESIVLQKNQVAWTPLNKARGDASPQAANLWGDRGTDRATGFLVKFKDGFSSPPHIHNITYRGIVISGQVHNDDPEAAEMWMPAGSYWTQPVGEVHITAAKGENNVAYIEIDSGPYLVQPPEESFDAGERPINVHADNIVWQDSSETTRVIGKEGVESPATYLLWIKADEAKTNASFLKLPARFEGEIRTHGERFRSVVVKGELSVGEGEAVNEVKPGSYFTNTGESVEKLKVTGNGEAILYIRNSGHYEVEAQ